MKPSTSEEAKTSTPSTQNVNVHLTQSTQKDTQQSSGKKNKGKKGGGNQNKQKPTNNAEGGRGEKNKFKFPCKIFSEDHLTDNVP